jgi:hypothetical protein
MRGPILFVTLVAGRWMPVAHWRQNAERFAQNK